MARSISVQIVGDSRSLERAFHRAGKAADGFSKKMGHLAKKGTIGTRGFHGLGRAAGIGAGIGGLSLLGIGALGVGAGISAVEQATNFESTLARIQGLAGQSAAQTKKWGNALLALGPALGKKPTELADALYFIASSGVKASKAMSVLRQSTMAAEAGLGDTQVVADAVTSVMNAYAGSGMSAAHATDVLVATVREGKGEADAFAGVIGNVAAFASKLNVPFEQVGAALAAMTQLGTDPRTAATQLQAFFSSVLKVSPKAEKTAAKMGFSFKNLTAILASGDLQGALKYIKDFAASHGGITALAPMFPNIRALRALLVLTANDGGKVEGVFKRMGKSAGSNKKAFVASAHTSQHAWDRFHAAIQALKISFAQGLLPVVTKVANWIADRLADPKVIARIRHMGKEFAERLRAIGAWFRAHWPSILKGLRTAWHILQKMASAAGKLGKIWGIAKWATGFELSKAFWTGITGGGKKSDWDKVKNLPRGPAIQFARQHGFLEKERKGDVLYLEVDGHILGKVVTARQQRNRKTRAGQTRGRHGGDVLAMP